jgi:hypothetical protein
MLKINKILKIDTFNITGQFNDGQIKKLDVYPLIQNHLHLKGVNNLLDLSVFKKAKVGDFGEIFWSNIVETKNETLLDYDISPEYFYFNGESIVSN